jgi:Xaa-Pro aminopeptidase
MGASRREIQHGDLVNIDLGRNRAGYHGDMARTYAVGELSDGIARLAEICLELEDVALAAIRPGVTAESVYDVTRAAAERLGVLDVFQGGGPYIDHGIGLELDEPPVLGPRDGTVLEEGLVLTVEPKLITPDFGAVNIEDDLVVTSDGYEILGSLPRCLFVVGSDGEVSRVP